MKILVVGDDPSFDECKEKFGSHAYRHVSEHQEAEKFLTANDLIFDFIIGESPAAIRMYSGRPVMAFLNTSMISLSNLVTSVNNEIQYILFGFNGLPGMLNRSMLEVSLLSPDTAAPLKKICQLLSTDYLVVQDRVGLVTPRVICMIINEAYFTVQEGIASREDIDLAMKVGTNYPYGPFEWCARIGIERVCGLLRAVYEDTKDERYRICDLLKRESLSKAESRK